MDLGTPAFAPLPWQIELYRWALNPRDKRHCAIFGGVGCGKTHGLAKVGALVGLSRPGSRSLLVSDSWPSLRGNNMPELTSSCRDVATWRASDREWHFPDAAVLELRHYQLAATAAESENPLEGRTVTGIGMVDEAQALSPQVLDHLTARCRGSSYDTSGNRHAPKMVINGRPDAGSRWWLRFAEAHPKQWLILRPQTAENPHNGPEYLLNLATRLDPVMFRCVTTGSEAPVVGAAFAGFEARPWPEGNLLRGFRFDPHREVWLGVDFGRRFPAVVWGQTQVIHGVEVDVIFDAVAPNGVLTPQLVGHILAPWRDRWPGRDSLYGVGHGRWRLDLAYVDPAGNSKSPHTGLSDINILSRPVGAAGDGLGGGLGARIITTTNVDRVPVHAGVTLLQGLMDPAMGHRRLLVTEELWDRDELAPETTRTIRRAIVQFRLEDIDKKAAGKGESRATHFIDALRYWAIAARWGGPAVPFAAVSGRVTPGRTHLGAAR